MTRSRKAFTLVELLVVIAIIGIIMAIVLPAVLATRRIAQRATCAQKLTQLALATHLHKGHLPGAIDVVGGKRASVFVQLLPYLAEQQLSDNWNDPSVSEAAAAKPYRPLSWCDASPDLDKSVASNSYISNQGFGPRGTDPSPFGPAVMPTAPTSNYDYFDAGRKANGPFVDRFTAGTNGWQIAPHLITFRSTDFKDGMSNTILFSESLAAGRWYETGLPTAMVYLYASEPGVPVNVGYKTGLLLTPSAVPAVARINGNKWTLRTVTAPEHARPSSAHPGGVNVVYADDNVQFMNEIIDYHVYQSKMAPHDLHSDIPFRRYVP